MLYWRKYKSPVPVNLTVMPRVLNVRHVLGVQDARSLLVRDHVHVPEATKTRSRI